VRRGEVMGGYVERYDMNLMNEGRDLAGSYSGGF